MKSVRWFVVVLASVVAWPAHAHVTVWPRESAHGAYEKYVVRVPTEGKIATVSVELQLPPEATFISVGAAVGYRYELRKAGDRVTAVVWTMRIEPGEFAEFALMARNPKEGRTLTWKAVQRFADGSSTQWIGPAGDKHPASVTTLTGGGGTHDH